MMKHFSNAPPSVFTSPEYLHYIAEYNGDIEAEAYLAPDYYITIMDEKFAIISLKLQNIIEDSFTLSNNPFPSVVYINRLYLYTMQALSPIIAANINLTQIQPPFFLTGKGVVVGIIDTGIDYLSKEFMNDDGTSRILGIWDQTISNPNSSGNVPFGTVYYKNDIDNAIKAYNEGKDPYEIVPSKDTDGHGTAMSGIIGAKGINPEIKGAAPDCNFVVVKLAESLALKKALNPSVPVYDQAFLMMAITYLYEYTLFTLNKPTVIYLPLGASLGNHKGDGLLESFINNICNNKGIAVVTGSGNQGDSGGHTSGYVDKKDTFKDIQLYISDQQKYLRLEVWVDKPNICSLEIISASGETSGIMTALLNREQTINYIFEKSKVKVKYYLPEALSGDELIEIDMNYLTPGIWKLRLYPDYILNGSYNIWLQQKGLALGNTGFTSPDPYGTFTTPYAPQIIKVGAYNQNNFNLVEYSGMAFLYNPSAIDIVAGGVNATALAPGNKTMIVNGTCVSAAVVAGASALMFQWGIVDKNDPNIYSQKLKTYLSRGTAKRLNDSYPNAEWGYGVLDMIGVFRYLE